MDTGQRLIKQIVDAYLEERRNRLLLILRALMDLPGGERIYAQMMAVPMLEVSAEDAERLRSLYPEIGLRESGGEIYLTFASILTVVTGVLCGRRLAFTLKDGEHGNIVTTGVSWWKDPAAPPEGNPDPTVSDWWCVACRVGFADQEVDNAECRCPLCGDTLKSL